jgi:hypothetical protein
METLKPKRENVNTLAATHAQDGTGGLFIERDASSLPPQLVHPPHGEWLTRSPVLKSQGREWGFFKVLC